MLRGLQWPQQSFLGHLKNAQKTRICCLDGKTTNIKILDILRTVQIFILSRGLPMTLATPQPYSFFGLSKHAPKMRICCLYAKTNKRIKVLDILELVPNTIDCSKVSPNESRMTPTMIGSQGFRKKHKIKKFIVLVPRLQLVKTV